MPHSAMLLTKERIDEFQETVWQYYREHGRQMPWREDPSPYKVLVSELMLQQTQVSRVIPKFNAFMYTCPNIAALADKSLAEVLELWSGLGYNRRAKYLHQAAQIVLSDFAGSIPDDFDGLVKLPGIGKNTAGAIMAYAFSQPVVFVETNIRTVYFHHFYNDAYEPISDKQLEALVARTIDHEHPREWYWALMDYGAYLKSTAGGQLSRSKHYVKQSPLKGSLREMRGRIIRVLVVGQLNHDELSEQVDADERFEPALEALLREGMIEKNGPLMGLTGKLETS
ncbi:MAG: A/G-specific adenine glycosylase [Candidatus Saccharimonadales bacterium]